MLEGPAKDEPNIVDSTEELSPRSHLIRAIETDPSNAKNYSLLADQIQEDERLRVTGEEYGQKELWLRSLELDPSQAHAYSDLGSILSLEEPGSTVSLHGRSYGEQDLYVKALELNPRLGITYENLGESLGPGESVRIINREYSAEELFEIGRKLQAEDHALPSDTYSAELHDSVTPTSIGHPRNLSEASLLRHDSADVTTAVDLGLADAHDTIIEARLQPHDRESALAAIEQDPSAANNYALLANMLEEEETVFVGGGACGQKELFVKALELDSALAHAFSDLGSILSLEEENPTILLHGRSWSEKQLYVQALELNPGLAITYENLSDCLHEDEVVSIRGQEFTAEDLQHKAAELEAQQQPDV